MKQIKTMSKKAIVSVIGKSLKGAANSTSCIVAYQPKTPAALKDLSKLKK